MSYDTDIFIIRKIINKECNNLKITLNKNIINFNEPHDWYFTDGLIKHTIYYSGDSRINPNDQYFLNSEPMNLKSNDSLEIINQQTDDRKRRWMGRLDS